MRHYVTDGDAVRLFRVAKLYYVQFAGFSLHGLRRYARMTGRCKAAIKRYSQKLYGYMAVKSYMRGHYVGLKRL
jgi:hypothetical protein